MLVVSVHHTVTSLMKLTLHFIKYKILLYISLLSLTGYVGHMPYTLSGTRIQIFAVKIMSVSFQFNNMLCQMETE
jgi:hypothetical protein